MQYAHPAHLSLEDAELRHYADVSWARQLQLASRDVELDLRRRGLCPEHVSDHGERAIGRVKIENTTDVPLNIPNNEVFYAGSADCSQWSQLWFKPNNDIALPAHDTMTIDVTATHWGTPWNVDAGEITHALNPDLGDALIVSNPNAAACGIDHPMTRATLYRALELIYGDLSRETEDMFDHKRRIYAKRYKEELDRLQQAGLPTGESKAKSYGSIRLIRG